MKREKTIGFVVYKKEGQGIRYLLLHHSGEYWNFPKGRMEKGETELEAALRELQEETGISQTKLIDGFYDEYEYDFDTTITEGVKKTIYKKAVFFMAEVEDQKVKISNEHIDFGWFDFNVALKRLFYQEGQDLLKRAHQFILNQQDFVI